MEDHSEEFEKVLEEEDGEGGWVDTHHYAAKYGKCVCVFLCVISY
ncbi:unnamed protein product [Trichobilharzia regenti]|nr:unnamed protein product [Trichobilharzia regenti]